jgi:mRNA-degrading endonuclease RelE of RelBE toxin-antitoxin system
VVDRIEKALRRLSDKERKAIRVILQSIKTGNVTGLDIKRLKGNTLIYRVRKGKIRIMYALQEKGGVRILAIERRSETTYRKY